MTVFRNTNNLSFVLHASSKNKNIEVPSWCIDFSEENWHDSNDAIKWEFEDGASGIWRQYKPLQQIQTGTLTVAGIYVGTIDNVINSHSSQTGFTKYRSLQQSLYSSEDSENIEKSLKY